MAEPKFTPGPYRANGCVIEGPKMGLQVATVSYRAAGTNIGFASQSKEEAFATADLLAAAPEMYEALRKVQSYLEYLPLLLEAAQMSGHAGNCTILAKEARSALAKAEGRSDG